MNLCSALFNFTHTDNVNSLIENITCGDILWVMAEQSNMSECDMLEWIIEHLNSSVTWSVYTEHGTRDNWPVLRLACDDLKFYLDYNH